MGLIIGILALGSALAASLAVLMSGSWFYEFNIRLLDITGITGIEKDVLVRNYKAIVDFLNPFKENEFTLPDLSFSENGAQHFADCKVLMTNVYVIGTAMLVFLIFLLVVFGKRLKPSCFLIASMTTLIVPATLGALIAVDFNRAFVLFHELFFTNDYWIFDPAVDPIIYTLPQDYFLNCGLFIISFWLLAFSLFLAVFFVRKAHTPEEAEK